jgi:prephenate dehydrogenase
VLPETLGVVGLDALGRLVAGRATRRGVRRVIGYALYPRNGVTAVKTGAVTELVSDVRRTASSAQLVVVSAPPLRSMKLLERLAPILTERGVFCTDVASVKAPIVAKATSLGLTARFAGSYVHGNIDDTRSSGLRPDRLEGAIAYVTALPGGDTPAREVADFWKRAVGVEPVMLDAEFLDRVLAWTTHLPRLVAVTLVTALARQGPKGMMLGEKALAATAPALNGADELTQILVLNKDAVLQTLQGVGTELEALRTAVSRGDERAIGEWLEQARSWRSRFTS